MSFDLFFILSHLIFSLSSPCPVLSRSNLSYPVLSYHVISFWPVLYPFLSGFFLSSPCPFLSCPNLSCPVKYCYVSSNNALFVFTTCPISLFCLILSVHIFVLVMSCPFPSCPLLSCPFPSCPLLSCPFPSCPLLSCPFPSCPLLSFPVLPCYVKFIYFLICSILSWMLSYSFMCPIMSSCPVMLSYTSMQPHLLIFLSFPVLSCHSFSLL